MKDALLHPSVTMSDVRVLCCQNDEYMGLDDIDIGQMPTSEEIFGKSYEEFKREF